MTLAEELLYLANLPKPEVPKVISKKARKNHIPRMPKQKGVKNDSQKQ